VLREEENRRITRVGPGAPMGNLMRRYWLPAALSEELPEPDGAPVRVRLLGEDLIAFRDSSGKVGLVDAFCPHRRAPMFFGRNEECGLRCVYHGWKFDAAGTCVDMPSEPPDSLFKTKVTIAAYPTCEGGGIVWTYMGPPETMPPPPDYELVRAPATHRHTSKTYEECNWLQALEGGIDSVHVTFLHNMNIADQSWLHAVAPEVEFERTGYGHVGDAQARGRAVRALVPLRHAVADDSRAQHRAARRRGPGADDDRPHLGADRRRDVLDLQLDVLVLAADPDRAFVRARA
jgi:phenylpropionate dioxygenase-like ring-hydroxylating dioxygenase large terminal subunit